MAKLVIAFAGDADTASATVVDELENWFSGSDGFDVEEFYVPKRILKTKQKGLANVVTYLEDEWEGFQTAPLSEMVDVLTDARSNGLDPVLVVLLGDAEPSEELAELMESVINEGIAVKDLAAGLDDVTLDEGEDEEPQTPVAEAEPAATGRTRRKRSTDTPEAENASESRTRPPRTSRAKGETPLKTRGKPRAAVEDDDTTPPWETPGEVVQRATDAGVAAAAKHATGAVVDAADVPVDRLREQIREVVREEIKDAFTLILSGALGSLGGPSGTTAVVKGEDGVWRRRGRGRPGFNEVVQYVSEIEATNLVGE